MANTLERQIYIGLMQLHRAVVTMRAFEASRGTPTRVVTAMDRASLRVKLSKIAEGVNPYHKGKEDGPQVGGGKDSLPEHIRIKDRVEAAETARVIQQMTTDHKRRLRRTINDIFDGNIETVEVVPDLPPGHRFCIFCGKAFPPMQLVFGWTDKMLRKVDGELASPLELRLRKHSHSEVTSTDPFDWEAVTTHSTDRAMPACRGCSPQFTKIKFANRHGQRFE